jgi:hypothetical protein
MPSPDRIDEFDVDFIRGKEYRKHPYDMRILGLEDHHGVPQPYLHVLCDGLRVKL